MSIAEKEDVVFRFLCYYSSLPSLYETIFSVRKLAEHFCTSVYHMRKIVNTLVQKELLVLTYDYAWYLDNAKVLLPESKWDFDVLDMVENHAAEIKLLNCTYTESEEKK